MKGLILFSMSAIVLMGANLSPGTVNKQMAAGQEVNLGTIVYERLLDKYKVVNLRPGGLDLGDVTEKATMIAYGSCMAAQISEDIVQVYSGKSMSNEQLLKVVDSRIPTQNVFQYVDKKKLRNDQEKRQELGMALMLNQQRKFQIGGVKIGQIQLDQARAQIEYEKRQQLYDNAPSTLDEAIRLSNQIIDAESTQRYVLNVKNLRDPNFAKLDSTGFLHGIYKSRFENTYFDLGEVDNKRMSPQGAITQWQTLGGELLPTQIDPNLILYTKGTHRITLNGDLVTMGAQCVLNVQGDQIRLVCPNAAGEIYSGGGAGGVYCGIKTTISRNSSGQFQFLKAVLNGEK